MAPSLGITTEQRQLPNTNLYGLSALPQLYIRRAGHPKGRHHVYYADARVWLCSRASVSIASLLVAILSAPPLDPTGGRRAGVRAAGRHAAARRGRRRSPRRRRLGA